MYRLIPIILALLGLGSGIGLGIFFRSTPDEVATDNVCSDTTRAGDLDHDIGSGTNTYEYVKLNNQFIVPVVEEGGVSSLVIMSLGMEVEAGTTEKVYAVEPKLRDAFLQVLFDHANAGGFRGAFTETNAMEQLRRALLETGIKILGKTISEILITDIIRQDISAR
ncbi:flagellar basal body-associated FliL family protein [Phaeovulum sp.]|uniref:flagellar basal body-associated FliL family protein n=1 Tax=Phaeovulum sp. TaxID=2934796 RepID=UPI0039E331AA